MRFFEKFKKRKIKYIKLFEEKTSYYCQKLFSNTMTINNYVFNTITKKYFFKKKNVFIYAKIFEMFCFDEFLNLFFYFNFQLISFFFLDFNYTTQKKKKKLTIIINLIKYIFNEFFLIKMYVTFLIIKKTIFLTRYHLFILF